MSTQEVAAEIHEAILFPRPVKGAGAVNTGPGSSVGGADDGQ